MSIYDFFHDLGILKLYVDSARELIYREHYGKRPDMEDNNYLSIVDFYPYVDIVFEIGDIRIKFGYDEDYVILVDNFIKSYEDYCDGVEEKDFYHYDMEMFIEYVNSLIENKISYRVYASK
jgi:hypothetical protein